MHDRLVAKQGRFATHQGQGAHGQFRPTRGTDLAHHDQPQRSLQPRGDLSRHRHAAARQGEHHRPVEGALPNKIIRERTPGGGPVGVPVDRPT